MTIFYSAPLHLKLIRFFTNLLIPKKKVLEDCTFSYQDLNSSSQQKKASYCLKNFSFFIVKDFLKNRNYNNISEKIEKNIIKDYKNFIPSNIDVTDKLGKVSKTDTKKVIKKDLFNISLRGVSYFCKKINRKVGYDDNFYEVINYEKSEFIKKIKLQKLLKNFDKKLNDIKLDNIIYKANSKKIRKKINKIYFHKNVEEPRPFHIDTYNKSIKAFLCFNTFKNFDKGPYAVIPSSHKFKFLHKINNFYNLTFGRSRWFDKMDASFWSSKYSIPFFCNSGDLIITRQSAIHGAFPAEKKYKRIMMVKHYIT